LPLPSGAATSAKQDTGNTSIASVDTKTGEVQASPTANTVLDRLKTIATNVAALATTIVLGAGSAVIGVVNLALGGTALDGNSGVKSAQTLRVVLATDQPALTNKLLVTPDLPSGASTAAKQPALGTAGTASSRRDLRAGDYLDDAAAGGRHRSRGTRQRQGRHRVV
jgi:hypothetical protein